MDPHQDLPQQMMKTLKRIQENMSSKQDIISLKSETEKLQEDANEIKSNLFLEGC